MLQSMSRCILCVALMHGRTIPTCFTVIESKPGSAVTVQVHVGVKGPHCAKHTLLRMEQS